MELPLCSKMLFLYVFHCSVATFQDGLSAVRVLLGVRDSLFSMSVQIGPEALTASCTVGYRGSFPVVTRTGRNGDRPTAPMNE